MLKLDSNFFIIPYSISFYIHYLPKMLKPSAWIDSLQTVFDSTPEVEDYVQPVYDIGDDYGFTFVVDTLSSPSIAKG